MDTFRVLLPRELNSRIRGLKELTIHDFLNGHAASAFGIEIEPRNIDNGRDFIVTGERGSNNSTATLQLNIQNRASIAFNSRSTAAAWKRFCGRSATNFRVAATETDLSATSNSAWVVSTMCTAASTANNDLILINGVPTHDCSCVFLVFWFFGLL